MCFEFTSRVGFLVSCGCRRRYCIVFFISFWFITLLRLKRSSISLCRVSEFSFLGGKKPSMIILNWPEHTVAKRAAAAHTARLITSTLSLSHNKHHIYRYCILFLEYLRQMREKMLLGFSYSSCSHLWIFSRLFFFPHAEKRQRKERERKAKLENSLRCFHREIFSSTHQASSLGSGSNVNSTTHLDWTLTFCTNHFHQTLDNCENSNSQLSHRQSI